MIDFEPMAPSAASCPAVFLDRDGVLIANRDGDYVRTPQQVRLLPRAAAAVRRLHAAGLRTVVVSNQACIGKGLMTTQVARRVHEEVLRRFAAAGASLWAGYLCPHAPFEYCPCRKPRPGMIERAAHRLNLDLTRSHLVGDALSDLAAGEAAGVCSHLVLTGRGRAQAVLPEAAGVAPGRIHLDLLAAVDAILDPRPSRPSPHGYEGRRPSELTGSDSCTS